MGKELDDICTSCPYIDAVKRHKQQLGAIEEYTKWLKRTTGILCVIHRHRFTIMPYYEQGNSAAATVGKTL